MNTFARGFLALMTAVCLTLGGAAEQPKAPLTITGDAVIPNIKMVKEAIVEYYQSGRYDEECRYVVNTAQQYLLDNLERHKGQKVAIVMDIDETALSNYPHIRECDFGYIPKLWAQWIQDAKSAPIVPTLELYKQALDKGVAVFFITGRTEKEREATVKNLTQAGYSKWAGLVCKADGSEASTQAYKAYQRKQLSESGYYVLINLGDQYSDLEGGYSEASFKLPNPLYWVR